MEEKEKIKLYQKWWFWSVIIFILVCVGIYICTILYTNNNYKNQAIEILTEYKKGKITNNEAKQKIDSLEQKVSKEYKRSSLTEMLFLSSELQRIEFDFVKGELSNTEIDTYIQEIRKIKDI